MNGTTRSILHAPRGGTALRGRGTSFQTGKTLRGNAAKQASRTGAFNNGASTTSGNVEERYTALKNARQREREDAIRRGLMSDSSKPMKLSEAITPVGTCQSMCAEFERVQRAVQREIWDEEKDPNRAPGTPIEDSMDESRMVKKFRRAAAGVEEQLPSDLRPPTVLRETCNYLFHNVLGSAKLAQVHHFVWDRTRAIRNDLSIQQLSKADDLSIAIECCERIARFHILSLHQLALEEKPYEAYDPKQEREQLDKTLLSLMQYYDDCRGRIPLPNEPEFRAYCVLFQLQDRTPDLEDRVQSWPREISQDRRVQQALKVYAAACNTSDVQGPFFGANATSHTIARQDWENFWQLVKSRKLSYLMACVTEIYFNLVRKMVLSGIVRTTRISKAPNTEWTLSDLGKLFYFDDDDQLEAFCGRFGLQFRDMPGGNGRYLEINGKTLPQEDSGGPSQLKSYLVESKREHRTLSAVIDGLSVRQAHDRGMVTTEEDEAEEDEALEEPVQEVDNGEDTGLGQDEEDEEDTLFVPEDKPQRGITAGSSSSTAAPVSFGEPLKTNFFGAAQPSSTPSVFGGSFSSGSSTFGKPSSSNKPSTGFGQPTQQPPNPFAPSAAKALDAPALQASSNPFARAPPAPSIFSKPLVPATSAGLGISSAPSTMGENPAPKLSFGTFSLGQTAANQTPSLFQPKPADVPSVQPGASLFAPKPPAVDAPPQTLGSTTPLAPAPALNNPFASSTALPKFAFPPLAPSEQQSNSPSSGSQSTTALGQPLGATSASPNPATQAETNSKLSSPQSSPSPPPPPPPQSQPSHPASPNTASQASNTAQPAGASSPPRRLSALDTKPKRPSPLSNSFTANDDATADNSLVHAATSSLKPPERDLFSQQQPPAPPSAHARALSAASEFDLILTRLATELVDDPMTGYLKQFVSFSLRSLVTEAQEKVYLERIGRDADEYRQFSLEDKYAKRWRHITTQRRNQRKLLERRKRQRRRLEESQDQDMGHSLSVLDTSSLRSSRASSAHVTTKPDKQVTVDALFQSTNGGSRFGANRQAQAGSKRTADSIDSGSVVSSRENLHKRARSTTHVDVASNLTNSVSRSSSQADIVQRSSFLGFSLAGDKSKGTSTTKSTYFRMKAMGLKPKPTNHISTDRGIKRSRSESLDAASAKLDASSLARLDREQDRSLMPPPPTRSVRSKPEDDDEALFARLRVAREALQENESFMRSEVLKEEDLRRSTSSVQSDHESPTMERARAEARLRLSSSANNREVPAYRLRESKFVPREQYGKAIERANELRASRSNAKSIAGEPAGQAAAPTLTKTGSPPPMQEVAARSAESQKRLPSLGHSNGSAGSLGTLRQFPTADADSGHAYVSGNTLGYGFSSNAASHRTAPATPQYPFSQLSSFEPERNTSNPFLQDAQTALPPWTRGFDPSSNKRESTAQSIPFSGSITQGQVNRSPLGTSNAFAQSQHWSFATAPEESDQNQDYSIPLERIPNALSASFGTRATTARRPIATQASSAAPENSYLSSQAASAGMSLLSNDADETAGHVAANDQNAAYGQAEFFRRVVDAADGNESPSGEEEADIRSHAESPAPQLEYTGRFAALAGDDGNDDYEDDVEDEEEEAEAEQGEGIPGRQEWSLNTPEESGLEEYVEAEQDPGSYQHGLVLTEAELDDDEGEDLEEDEYILEDGSTVRNGYLGQYSVDEEEEEEEDDDDEEEGYADGDVEDEDGYDDEGEGYDEETDEDPGMYATSYQRNYGRPVYPAPTKSPVGNEGLQQVGNDENEPIELSD